MSLDRFEQSLLESGRRDGPSPARRRGARADVLRAVAGMTAPPFSSSAGAAASAGPKSMSATGAKALPIGKLLLIVGIGAGIALAMLLGPHGAAAPPAEAIMGATAASVDPPAPVVEAESTVPTVAVSALPSVRAPRRVAVSGSPAPASANTEDPVAVEARLLDATRRCLVAGDQACARSHLADYEARFSRGRLVEEAALLAIDVARAAGDHEEARRRARAHLAEHPRGVRSSWVRKIAGVEDPSSEPR